MTNAGNTKVNLSSHARYLRENKKVNAGDEQVELGSNARHPKENKMVRVGDKKVDLNDASHAPQEKKKVKAGDKQDKKITKEANKKEEFIPKPRHPKKITKAADKGIKLDSNLEDLPIGEKVLCILQKFREDHKKSVKATDKNTDKKMPSAPETTEQVRLLGSGGFGDVWEVRMMPRNETAAMKRFKKTIRTDKIDDMMKNEIRVHKLATEKQRAANKSFFPKYFGYKKSYEEGLLYMEFCAKGTLSDYERYYRKQFKERLCDARVVFFMKQVLQGLQFLHEIEIIHRDIKIENVLLTSDMTAKISDFGLSVTTCTQPIRKTVCGTPGYMAIEILEKPSPGYSYSVDVWSFGVMIHLLLTGSFPFTDDDAIQLPVERNNKLSDQAFFLLHVIFQKPDKRWNLSKIAKSQWMTITPIHPKSAPKKLRNVEAEQVMQKKKTRESSNKRELKLASKLNKENYAPEKLEQQNILNGSVRDKTLNTRNRNKINPQPAPEPDK